ncbi:MAG: peptidase M28, partial [Planctomycetota bacterium]|nr:peptidase M28 [Planctomycetota bacterium]
MRSLTTAKLLSILFLSSAGFAQDAAPTEAGSLQNQIRTEGLEKSEVQDWLKTLTQEFGPRLTGSERLLRAQNWARDEFEKMGLSAELEEWGT